MQREFTYNKSALPRPVLFGHDDWIALYYKAWEIAFENVNPTTKTGWKPFLTCMPGVDTIWQWDSCIMTFITNYSNGTINAFNNLDNLYHLRRESDGYMSMAYEISTEEPTWPGRINPPLMAWAEWSHYLISGDFSRFEKVLPALEGCYNFIENSRKRSSGLYYFEDPGSSGMDNSPRGGYVASGLLGSDVCFIDLACQQSLSAKCMSLMFEKIDNPEKAEFYKAENARINALINKYHYSEKAGFYFDFFSRYSAEEKVKLINSKTAAVFWTLLSNAATGDRLKKVVSHMQNPNEFNTLVPFASLSKDDLNYDKTGGYWLGSVWAPTNYAAIKGLEENGYTDFAREVSIRYLDAVCHVNKDFGSIWECYAQEEFKPATKENGEIVRDNFVGWSGIAPITLLIENIIGVKMNADKNTVNFTPFEPCGIENIYFNGQKISLLFDGKIFTATAEKPFTLIFNGKPFAIKSGENEFKI